MRVFYRDGLDAPLQKRWELFDWCRDTSPGFVVARREDGKQVSVRENELEIEVLAHGQNAERGTEPR